MRKLENIKEFYSKKNILKKMNKNKYEKRNSSIIYKMIDNLRIRSFNYIKLIDGNHKEILGCTSEEFENHIKSQFKENMCFENYGDWELDHIKPLSKFDLTKENNIRECFHYTNIQPLWKIENRKKFNKL